MSATTYLWKGKTAKGETLNGEYEASALLPAPAADIMDRHANRITVFCKAKTR